MARLLGDQDLGAMTQMGTRAMMICLMERALLRGRLLASQSSALPCYVLQHQCTIGLRLGLVSTCRPAAFVSTCDRVACCGPSLSCLHACHRQGLFSFHRRARKVPVPCLTLDNATEGLPI